MANLLGRQRPDASRGAPVFDAAECARIGARLDGLFRIFAAGQLTDLDGLSEAMESELEELDATPDPALAQALLDSIGAARLALSMGERGGPGAAARVAGGPDDHAAGAFVCHLPGRSLSTGEAEIASLGWFDGMDRPPLACWLGLLAWRDPSAREDRLAVVAWIPPDRRERVEAAIRACPSGALMRLEDVSREAADQVRALALRALAAQAPRACGPAGSRPPGS